MTSMGYGAGVEQRVFEFVEGGGALEWCDGRAIFFAVSWAEGWAPNP